MKDPEFVAAKLKEVVESIGRGRKASRDPLYFFSFFFFLPSSLPFTRPLNPIPSPCSSLHRRRMGKEAGEAVEAPPLPPSRLVPYNTWQRRKSPRGKKKIPVLVPATFLIQSITPELSPLDKEKKKKTLQDG